MKKGDHIPVSSVLFLALYRTIKLTSTTSNEGITALKSLFFRYGIPEEMVSDNGSQYISQEMKDFAKMYGFKHITSSPHYPQGNGQAERTVRTIKNLLKNKEDPYLSLLSYRVTPLSCCRLTPVKVFMGRKLRTLLPMLKDFLKPDWKYLDDFRKKEAEFKRKQKDYDRRNWPCSLVSILKDSPVWLDGDIPGTVTSTSSTPKSYLVVILTGE